MNTAGDDYDRSPSSGVGEEEWTEKKESLLRGISEGRSALKIDRESLTREKEKLVSDVERLEDENHLMARSVKDFQLQLSEKRSKSQMLFTRSDALKKKLVGLLARERSLQNEIQFYESEKARLSDTHLQVSERLRTNISALDTIVKDIDFMKGEMGTLINKMGMLEREVPVKVSDVDNVDEKITGALKVLKDLYSRMQGVERKVKTNYYKKKKQRWSSHDY
jgi:chromosome segregation ATPase